MTAAPERAELARLRVLLIEDQDEDAYLILRELGRAGFTVESSQVEDAEGLRAAIDSGPWDVVLSDHVLPGFGSQEAFEILRSAGLDAPFIVVSGHIGEETVAETLRKGAADYVNKDRLETLGPAVRHSLRTAQAARGQRAAEAALRESQSRLQALLDHAPLPLSLRDLDGRFLLINQVAAEVLGDTVENLLQRTPQEVYGAEVATQIDDHELAVRAGTGAVTFELTVAHPDASEHHYLVTKYPVTDSQGQGTGVGGISMDVTERRHAEMALRDSEEATRAIIEHAPDAFISFDPSAKISAWNPAAERMFGWPAHEVIGKALAEVMLAPEHRAADEAGPSPLSAGGVPAVVDRPFELSVQDRQGHPMLVEITISRVMRRGTDVFHAFVRDVTAQRQAHARLQEAEEQFRQAFDNAPIGIALVSPEGRWLRVNKALTNILGYSSAELLGTTFQEITHPDDLAVDLDFARQLLAGDVSTCTLEKRYLRADGSPVWILLSVSLVRDGCGQPLHFVAQIQDIDERKLADLKFRGLLESAPDAIVIVDECAQITLVNAETEHLFGYHRDELLGQPIEVLVPERFRDVHRHHRGDFLGDPHARPMGADLELHARHKDGREIPVEISLGLLETPDGILTTASIRDITERRRLEQVLLDANQQLQAANRAKDRFLASMSHELRTPLNAILGFTGTLLMGLPGPLNEEQTRQLQTVQSSGRHLLSLISDLLDLAKIEAGKVQLDVELIDCAALAEEVAAGLMPLADRKGIALQLESPEGLSINVNRRALSQILINLTNNAIKFTEHGAVRIEVSQHEVLATRVTRFRVTDTGAGIKVSDQAKLFAAFEQVGSPDAQPYEGTGLGLYISQTLAHLMNAEITFESQFGKGSAFTLEIREPAA